MKLAGLLPAQALPIWAMIFVVGVARRVRKVELAALESEQIHSKVVFEPGDIVRIDYSGFDPFKKAKSKWQNTIHTFAHAGTTTGTKGRGCLQQGRVNTGCFPLNVLKVAFRPGEFVRVDYSGFDPSKKAKSKWQNTIHTFAHAGTTTGTEGRGCLQQGRLNYTGCFPFDVLKPVDTLKGLSESGLEELATKLHMASIGFTDIRNSDTQKILKVIGINVGDTASEQCKSDAYVFNLAAMDELKKFLTPSEKIAHGLVDSKWQVWEGLKLAISGPSILGALKPFATAGKAMRLAFNEIESAEITNMRSLLIGHSTDVTKDLEKAMSERAESQSLGVLAKNAMFAAITVALASSIFLAAGSSLAHHSLQISPLTLLLFGPLVSVSTYHFLAFVGQQISSRASRSNQGTFQRTPLLWSGIKRPHLDRLTCIMNASLLIVRPLERHSESVLDNCEHADTFPFWSKYSNTFALDIGRMDFVRVSIAINKTSVATIGARVQIQKGSTTQTCTVLDTRFKAERQIQISCDEDKNGEAQAQEWINVASSQISVMSSNFTSWKPVHPLETSIFYQVELPSIGRALQEYATPKMLDTPWKPKITIVDFKQTCNMMEVAICSRILEYVENSKQREHVLANCACENSDERAEMQLPLHECGDE